LTDLRGHSLALVRPGSMSGHLFPMAYLRKQKIDAKSFFKSLIEAKDHAEVCRLVLEGRVDAGVTLSDYRAPDELVVDGCAMAGMDPDAFTVVSAVGPIPNDIIAVRPNLEADLRQRLSDALTEMRRTESGRKQMDDIFHADGFVPAQDTDFVAVRELEQYLGD
jgi:phosphonate transport system substrate-binding protein